MGLFKETNRFYEKAVNLPGAVAAVFLLSIIYPPLGIFPNEVTTSILISFTIPALYIFFVNVILNKDVKIGFHLIIVLFSSFVLYITNKWPFDIHQFFAFSFFFLFGALVSAVAYGFYYILYRVGKKQYQETSYRARFVVSFLPTVILMLMIGYFLSVVFDYWIVTFNTVISS